MNRARPGLKVGMYVFLGCLLYTATPTSSEETYSDQDLMSAARAALSHKNCPAAVTFLDQATDSTKDSGNWLNLAAKANECAGNLDRALSLYKSYEEMFPGNSDVQTSIGNLMYQIGVRDAKEKEEEAKKREEEDKVKQAKQREEIDDRRRHNLSGSWKYVSGLTNYNNEFVLVCENQRIAIVDDGNTLTARVVGDCGNGQEQFQRYHNGETLYSGPRSDAMSDRFTNWHLEPNYHTCGLLTRDEVRTPYITNIHVGFDSYLHLYVKSGVQIDGEYKGKYLKADCEVDIDPSFPDVPFTLLRETEILDSQEHLISESK
jgi:hypothetical protein